MRNLTEVARDGKLMALARLEGLSVDEMLSEAVADGTCPGICVRDGCDYTTEVEPDCQAGWCEECRAQTVASCLVLAGVI